MARNNKQPTQMRRQRRRRTTRRTGLTLGGPISTIAPGVTITNTSTFDLGTTPMFPGLDSSVVPLSMRIYAIPPRDTDPAIVDQTGTLARIRCLTTGQTESNVQIELQTNMTVLQYNAGPRLCASVNFKRLYTAGLTLPITTKSSVAYYTPITLTLTGDDGEPWPSTALISIYVVTQYGDILSPPSPLFPFNGDATTVTRATSIDNDVQPSKIVTNNTVAGYRFRAQMGVTRSKVRALTAGAAEAHPING